MKCLVDLLLKFKEFMWRHLVRTLGNRGGAGLQVDDKFDFSDRGYSRQFFWEDVGKIVNDRNVLDAFEGGGIQSIHHKYLCFSITDNSGGVINNLARGVKKLDRLGATIECGIVKFQPVHSQNEVYGGRHQDYGGSMEFNSFNFNDGFGHYLGGSALAYRGANNHRWVHLFQCEVMRQCKCFRQE